MSELMGEIEQLLNEINEKTLERLSEPKQRLIRFLQAELEEKAHEEGFGLHARWKKWFGT